MRGLEAPARYPTWLTSSVDCLPAGKGPIPLTLHSSMGDETASRWARELLSAYFTALHRDEEFATSSWNADTSHDTYAHATDPEAVNDELREQHAELEAA